MRDAWHAEVLRTKQIHDACRVLLLHLATGVHRDGPHKGQRFMTDTGHIHDTRHRELAEHLGITEKRVGIRLQEAREKGLLVIVGGGHNGQPTMYAAQLHEVTKPPAERGPSRAPDSLRGLVKPPAHKGPFVVAERGPSAPHTTSPNVTKPPAERGPYVRAHVRALPTEPAAPTGTARQPRTGRATHTAAAQPRSPATPVAARTNPATSTPQECA